MDIYLSVKHFSLSTCTRIPGPVFSTGSLEIRTGADPRWVGLAMTMLVEKGRLKTYCLLLLNNQVKRDAWVKFRVH
jgi:hypothetical protein